jgi:hypothetical protein
VVGAVQEGDGGGIAVGGFDGQALGVVKAAPGVGANTLLPLKMAKFKALLCGFYYKQNPHNNAPT